MALRLTNAADYAIRSMLYIASLPEGRVVLRSEVAETQNIPSSFMAKILRGLVRAGLLRSSRGVHGGFSLARSASEISLLDVVEAIEGPVALTSCLPDPEACEHAANCPAHSVWASVQSHIAEILGKATLEVLVSAPRRNGRVELQLSS
jgi:Rrf2 family iron-sulfur cluster assembly transcriptional regulator